ncbi:MAG: alpha/beta fold hydrolase [Bacteroidales bacterium]|nr:alpha/beta fold hydrolase [Bacteroidales bacterium]
MKKIVVLVFVLAVALTAQAQTGDWSGKLNVQGTSITLVLHLDADGCKVDSPDQGVRGIPAEASHTDLGKLVISIPSFGATYEGFLLAGQLVGTFTQHGVSFPLTLTPGLPKLNRPQTPKGPFPYATEEVSFANGDAVLKGTLTLPEGCSRKTPVLVMVTGSGLQNRDEEIFEHKPFAVIADALARAGIATLRYDDRGFGESTGDAVSCTTEDLKNDALAGIKLLRERFDRVGVIGHSEGGTIALMLAAEKQADFIVSLAGMVISGEETLLIQNRLLLVLAGFPETTVDTYCKALKEAFDATVAGMNPPAADKFDLPEGLKQNYQAVLVQSATPYMRYFLALDMRPLLNTVTCPVLALNGTKDFQVDPEQNLSALRTGLPGNPNNRIVPVEGVNHLFQHCPTGNPSEYKDIEETFAPEALATLIEWLKALR